MRRHGLLDRRHDGPAALPRIVDEARIARQLGVFRQRHRGQVEEPGADDAAAAPDLGDVRQIDAKALIGRQRGGGGAAQDVEALRIGLHQAVFDAVMDHLDKAAGAARAAMHIAARDAGVASLAAGGNRNGSRARRQGGEDRIEMIDHVFVATDHHAVAALEAPDAAAGAAIDIVNSLLS